MKGAMNIDFSEKYDQEDDIYYVSFKTGEPSCVVEINDVILLEVGMFTNMPTGFRILNFKKHKVGSVRIIFKKIRKTVENAAKNLQSIIRSREDQLERKLEEVLA